MPRPAAGKAGAARDAVIALALTLAAGCSLFAATFEEVPVSGPIALRERAVLTIARPYEPTRRLLEVCLRLKDGYGQADPNWDIRSPDGSEVAVEVALESQQGFAELKARSFLLRPHVAFACFHEFGDSQGRVPRRRYTAIAIRASQPIPLDGVMLLDSDPP